MTFLRDTRVADSLGLRGLRNNRTQLSVAVMVFLVRQVQGVFTSSPFRGRWSLLRWILSCGEKVANFRLTRYLSGPKHTAFFATSLPFLVTLYVLSCSSRLSFFSSPRSRSHRSRTSMKTCVRFRCSLLQACDFIRMKGHSLVALLEAARIDQEYRTHYWVRKLWCATSLVLLPLR